MCTVVWEAISSQRHGSIHFSSGLCITNKLELLANVTAFHFFPIAVFGATKEVQNYLQGFGEEEEDTESFSSKTVVSLSVFNLDMLAIEKKRYRESAHQKILV